MPPSAIPVSSALFGIKRIIFFFIYFINKLEDLSDKGRRQGDYVFNWQGICNTRKKCLKLFQFQYHCYTWVLNSLRTYDGI